MGDIFFFFPIVMVLIVCFVVVPIVARAKAERGGQSSPSASQKNKNHGYNREVDSIHITSDAATEQPASSGKVVLITIFCRPGRGPPMLS